MNSVFRELYSKSKYVNFFAYIAKFISKYCKSNISCDVSNVKVLAN